MTFLGVASWSVRHSLQASAFSSAGSVVLQVQSAEMLEPCPPSALMTMQGGTVSAIAVIPSRYITNASARFMVDEANVSTEVDLPHQAKQCSTTAVAGTCSCRHSQPVMNNHLYPSIPAATFIDGVGIGVTPKWGTI